MRCLLFLMIAGRTGKRESIPRLARSLMPWLGPSESTWGKPIEVQSGPRQ